MYASIPQHTASKSIIKQQTKQDTAWLWDAGLCLLGITAV